MLMAAAPDDKSRRCIPLPRRMTRGQQVLLAWSDNSQAFGPSQGRLRFDIGGLTSTTMGAGTMAGYRAHETFLDITLPHEAVARTDQVVGNLRVRQLGPAKIAIQGGCFAVELNTLTSIDALPGRRAQDRDELYGDFLDTRDYPYAVLTLHRTEVPVFSSRPQHVIVSGDLSVAGATRPVAVAVDAQTVAGGVQAVGSMAIDAHDFGIRLPGEGDPIAVDSHLTLEFLLVLEQVDHQRGDQYACNGSTGDNGCDAADYPER